MRQINEGIVDKSIKIIDEPVRDICILCDAQTEVTIRPNDVCICCDAFDWFEKDE